MTDDDAELGYGIIEVSGSSLAYAIPGVDKASG